MSNSSMCQVSIHSDFYIKGKRKMSYLFLRESVAAAHFADLVTLLVPARGAVPAVVLLLAAATLATPLALLLGGLLLSQAVSIM